MNDFFKKIKGFFKDDESFFEAKQLLEKNWHNLTPDYFKKLLKSLNYAAFVIDVAGNYIFLNEEARRLVESKKPSESNIWKDIPGLEDTEFGKKLILSMETQSNLHLEIRFPTNQVWFEIQIISQLDYSLIIAKEISEKKSTEIGYKTVLTKNRAILSSIPDDLYGIHKDGKVINYKKYPDFTGWDSLPDSMNIQFSSVDKLFPESKLKYIQNLNLETGKSETLEYSIHEYDGEKYYEARFTKTGDSEMLAIIRNITDRKRAEALKNEFISLVSHELRTPLTSIKGSIELLLAGVSGELSNQTKSLLNICKKNTQRLVRFVTDLLDIEALDSGNINFKFKAYCLQEITQSSVDGMRTFAEQYHVLLNLKKYDGETFVYVDEDRLNHCITNLISNAVKYTPKFSEVEITIEKKDSVAQILIKDNGPGIDPSFQPRLFHRFAQGTPPKDKLVGGSGLGLSITKGFIEAMKGKIFFHTSDTGTTFIIELPLVSKPLPTRNSDQ